MYYSQLEAYKIRLRILENYVLIPHFPQELTYKELYLNLVGSFYA